MIILFELNRKAGFYSEFFFLCWAYIHSKALRCRFYITHKNWTYTFKDGWHDYFEKCVYYYDKTQNLQDRQSILLQPSDIA